MTPFIEDRGRPSRRLYTDRQIPVSVGRGDLSDEVRRQMIVELPHNIRDSIQIRMLQRIPFPKRQPRPQFVHRFRAQARKLDRLENPERKSSACGPSGVRVALRGADVSVVTDESKRMEM